MKQTFQKKLLFREITGTENLVKIDRVYMYHRRYTVIKDPKSLIYGCIEHLGPVVQSIVSLTSSLRGQLVKCFMTL